MKNHWHNEPGCMIVVHVLTWPSNISNKTYNNYGWKWYMRTAFQIVERPLKNCYMFIIPYICAINHHGSLCDIQSDIDIHYVLVLLWSARTMIILWSLVIINVLFGSKHHDTYKCPCFYSSNFRIGLKVWGSFQPTAIFHCVISSIGVHRD